jgi:hypothetical protein
MRQFTKPVAIILASLTIGTIFGPLVVAAAAAAIAPATGRNGEVIEATKLVEAYQNRLEPGLLFLTLVAPDDGAECGYDPDTVFPGGIEALAGNGSYTDYLGYFALYRWRNANKDDAWIRSITASIGQRMTPYEAGFLRRCIEGTLFADLCMAEVREIGETVPRFDRKQKTGLLAEGHEDRVVCTFVDGVAARKGIRLSRR